MVCGESTAFGSFTVTIPVALPAGSDCVFNTKFSGKQVLLSVVVVQLRDDPTEAPIHETDDETLKFSEPLPML